jgi:hypothetical protein
MSSPSEAVGTVGSQSVNHADDSRVKSASSSDNADSSELRPETAQGTVEQTAAGSSEADVGLGRPTRTVGASPNVAQHFDLTEDAVAEEVDRSEAVSDVSLAVTWPHAFAIAAACCGLVITLVLGSSYLPQRERKEELIRLRFTASGSNGFALYHVHNMTTPEVEDFLHITQSGKHAKIEVPSETALSLRSLDMQFRAYVIAGINDDPNTMNYHRWVLCFVNPMMEGMDDMVGDSQFQLVHGTSGSAWIMPGNPVCHSTAALHSFDMRRRDKSVVASVRIDSGPSGEL